MPSPPLTFGRLLYLAYYSPRGVLERSWRAGGPWQQWRDARGRAEMQAAARELPPAPLAAESAPEVYFLTGRRFWYQTAWCLHSLHRHFGPVRPVLIDDGSIDETVAAACRRQFPSVRIERAPATEQRLDEVLPAHRFPSLRSQRRTYLHLRKLTDVHAGLSGARLVLDSDMLFFRRPEALAAWFARPDRPIHMVDVHDAYGYSAAALAALVPHPVPSCLNVGICGLRSETIDWERLEFWTARLLAQHGTSYYLEQALVALWLAGTDPLRLPAADYRVMPDLEECRQPTSVLHHYVDLSKRGYFRYAWRHGLPTTS